MVQTALGLDVLQLAPLFVVFKARLLLISLFLFVSRLTQLEDIVRSKLESNRGCRRFRSVEKGSNFSSSMQITPLHIILNCNYSLLVPKTGVAVKSIYTIFPGLQILFLNLLMLS